MNVIPLIYVDCDVPEGLTLTEYRRRTRSIRARRLHRLRRLLAGHAGVA